MALDHFKSSRFVIKFFFSHFHAKLNSSKVMNYIAHVSVLCTDIEIDIYSLNFSKLKEMFHLTREWENGYA
ncbi:hypothetical protein BpHYR1_043912 [Brachionus plicatilis]|uniref:Uncharacterized protein n=1 Tax=Brachionus plicatilis TaxID=10195 RepID=A0A3M7S9K2_BRAPC|nr:hypothetical protein BpHYR1_043912 [Brachionus plicatilis]